MNSPLASRITILYMLFSMLASTSSASAQNLTLIAPAAGDKWPAGTTQTIRWQTTGVMNLAKLKYSTDGGATWITITGSAQNSGSFQWIVPNIVTNAARLAVMDTDGAPKIESAIFSIISAGEPVEPEPGFDVHVSWNANTEADLAGYRLFYGDLPRDYLFVFETGNITTYTIKNLLPGTYYIALKAYDFSGNQSDFSEEVSFTIAGPAPDLEKPNPPTGVSAIIQPHH